MVHHVFQYDKEQTDTVDTMRRSVILAALNANSGADASQEKPKALSADASRLASGGGFGPLLTRKPFKPPMLKTAGETSSRGRKRRKVDYAGMGGGEEGGEDGFDPNSAEGDDGDAGPKTRKVKKGQEMNYKGCDATGQSLLLDKRQWPVFQAKADALKRGFSIPKMKNNKGEVIETRPSLAALGTRRAIEIPPRPLHDPMSEQAIVLYDPTVDDREAEAQKQAIREEQRLIEEGQTEASKAKGPHKSLAEILGLNKKEKKEDVKVPVVIDPRLAKILRPHQVEGVKVSLCLGRDRRGLLLTSLSPQQFLYRCTTGLIAENAHG